MATLLKIFVKPRITWNLTYSEKTTVTQHPKENLEAEPLVLVPPTAATVASTVIHNTGYSAHQKVPLHEDPWTE